MMRPAIVTVFLAISFVASLFFTGHHDIIYAPAAFLLLVAAGVAVLPSFWRGCQIPRSGVGMLLAVLSLYVTLSLTWSSVPFTSMVTWIVFISLPVTFFSLSMPEARRNFIIPGVCMMLTVLSLLGGWAMIQALFFVEAFGRRAHHPLLNANDLATLLNLGVFPVLSFLLWRQQRDRFFYAAIISVLLMFGGLLATQSRSGFIAMLIALGLLLVLRRPSVKMTGVVLGAGSIMLLGMLSVTGGGLAGRLMKIMSSAGDPDFISRFSLWKSTLAMIAGHPWAGTGLGTFYLYYPSHRAPQVENSAGFFAHIDPLQFGVEMGVAATLLIYALFMAVAWRTIVALRATEKNTSARAAVAGLSCALLTLALHAHAGFPLYVMPVLIVCGVWLAAWHAATGEVLPAAKNYAVLAMASWERAILSLSVVASASLVMVMASSSAAGQYYASHATEAVGKGSVTEFLANIERAERWAPPSFIEPEVQLAGFYVDAISRAGILFSPEERAQMAADGIALLTQAESMNPIWAEIDFKRGRIQAATGRDAADDYRRALAKDPQHARARLELARMAVAAGKPSEAYELLLTGLKYPQPRQTREEYKAMLVRIASVARVQKEFIEEGRVQ
jgi:O-antigen ligase